MSRLMKTEEGTYELEDRLTEITQSKEQRFKTLKTNEQILPNLSGKLDVTSIPEGGNRKNNEQKIYIKK